jgi:large subunit ribosomal protein L2
MGKRLKQQRRGKGTPRYLSPGHRFLGRVNYNDIKTKDGKVIDIVNAPGRSAPVAVVDFGKDKNLMLAHDGMQIDQMISFNEASPGNVVELEKIPEGTKVCNLELRPGDGGKLCRSSGTFAMVLTKERNKCIVLMPSKKKKVLSSKCRATIGTIAGSGRKEKPFMKAGTRYRIMHSMNRHYPRVCGVSMNAVDHPFGGSASPGKHKTVSGHAPPGKKVGSISARRTGRKKRK